MDTSILLHDAQEYFVSLQVPDAGKLMKNNETKEIWTQKETEIRTRYLSTDGKGKFLLIIYNMY